MAQETTSNFVALRELMQGKGMLGFDPAALSGQFSGFGATPDKDPDVPEAETPAAPVVPANTDVTIEKPEDAS